MGKGKPILLATITFQSKKEAISFFREMLYRYRPGDRVAAVDAAHLTALLSFHQDYKEKWACGIDHFEVMSADYGTQCFGFVRVDGTVDNFSFHHCIDNAGRGG